MGSTFSSTSFITGATLGASLIIAIGAQNVFVLRQGLRREHVAVVVAICALLDIVLMTLGVGGLGAAVNGHPRLLDGAALLGAVVLVVYGLMALRRALGAHALRAEDSGAARLGAEKSRGTAVVQALSISLLNPHVYLDTVVLVGAVGARQAPGSQISFLFGAGLASCVWFASIGFGARVLSPLFARPIAWRVLDAFVCMTMLWIAFKLAQGAIG